MPGLAALLTPIFSQPQTQVALIEFDSAVSLVQDFTHREDLIDKPLTQPHSGDGGAAILDAMQYAVRLLEHTPEGQQPVILLISETRDHGSHSARIRDVIEAIGEGNTVLYALPFSPSLSQVLDTERGSNRDERRPVGDFLAPLMMASQAVRKNTPKAIASMTGGEYELFSSRKSFERLMTEFTNRLHSRYLLSFQAQDPHPGLHQVRVRLRDAENRTVLARTSYWAAGQKP